jgi:hypothetical protein
MEESCKVEKWEAEGETDCPCCRCSEGFADGEGEMGYGQTMILRIPKKTRERREGRVTIKVYLRSIICMRPE